MKHFSTLSLFVTALLLTFSVSAQNISLTVGEKGDSKGYQPTMLHIDKADVEGHYYSVEPELNAFSKVKGISIREVDLDFTEIHSVSVPEAAGCFIYHVQRDGNRMHVLLTTNEKKRYALRYVCVDLTSFTIVTDRMLVDIAIGKKQYVLDWCSLSAAENYFGYVYAFVDEKGDQAEVHAMVFDRSMQLQWSHPIEVSALSQVLTTNDGRLATIGAINGDGKKDGAAIEFSISTASGSQRGHCTTTNKLGGLALLNVFGDKVLATALETDRGIGWAGTFNAGKVVTSGTVYIGYSSFLFDVAIDRLVNTDSHLFTKEDAQVFYNASLITEILKPDVNFLALRTKVATPNGGAVLYGRTWHEKVVNTGNGMATETYYYNGMMLINVDSTGSIVWMRPIMHDNGNNADFAENTETDMVVNGKDIILITNEANNASDTYDPREPVRRTTVMVHGAISAYRFAPDGQVTKNRLITKGTNIITTPMRRQADGHYTFIIRRMKGFIADLTIR